jgi:[ribosomal protein S5]-alanine N-acetyltransferase
MVDAILETDRLFLREFVLNDLAPFFRMVSDPDVTRFIGVGAKTAEAARTMLVERTMQDYRKHGYGRWATVLKSTGAVIGFTGLKYLDEFGECDLGYRFFKEHWGQGLATEASRAVLAYGFDKLRLNQIAAFADIENKASVRVLEKLGFRFENFTKYWGHDVARYVVERPGLII